MKIRGRPSGREIWENGTVLTAKSGDILPKQNSLCSYLPSSNSMDLSYLLNLVFQIGLLIIIITVTIPGSIHWVLTLGQPFATILHALSHLTLTITLWISHYCYFSPSQSTESICKSHYYEKWQSLEKYCSLKWLICLIQIHVGGGTRSFCQAEDTTTLVFSLGDDPEPFEPHNANSSCQSWGLTCRPQLNLLPWKIPFWL